MTVAVKSTIIWGVTSCSLVDIAGMTFKTWEQAKQTASSPCVRVDSSLLGLLFDNEAGSNKFLRVGDLREYMASPSEKCSS